MVMTIIMPILIYLSFVCAEYEIVSGIVDGKGRESLIGLGLWQLIVISMELGLFITYIGTKKHIHFLRFLFLAMGLLSATFGAYAIGKTLLRAHDEDPSCWNGIPDFERWQNFLDEYFYTIGGLILNIVIMVVLMVCESDITDEIEKKNCYTWNFEIYSRWTFKCLLISVFLTLATIFATVIAQICQSSVPNEIMTTVIGLVLILFGSFTFGFYEKKKEEEMIKTVNDWANFTSPPSLTILRTNLKR